MLLSTSLSLEETKFLTQWSLSAWFSALLRLSTQSRTSSPSSTTSTLTPIDLKCMQSRMEATRNSVKRCSKHTRVLETGSVSSHEQHPGTYSIFQTRNFCSRCLYTLTQQLYFYSPG